jgi:hypothetical protein
VDIFPRWLELHHDADAELCFAVGKIGEPDAAQAPRRTPFPLLPNLLFLKMRQTCT